MSKTSARTKAAADLQDEQLELLEKRQKLLIPLAETRRPPRSQSEAVAAELGITPRTVRRLVTRYRQTGDPLVFIPRLPGSPTGRKKLDPGTEEVIQQAIDRIFARRQRPSLQSVYRDICLACLQRGFDAPGKSTFLRRVREREPEVLLRRREGRKAAQPLKPAAGSARPGEYPLHVIQMDHTKADVIVVDSTHRKPIGRPFITLAIDLCSRCIAGYHVSLEAPSATSVGLSHTAGAQTPQQKSAYPEQDRDLTVI